MATPRVSVVVPVYNRRRMVREAIDSVLAQTLADFELIVVDDGSTDGTGEAVAAAYAHESRLRLVRQANGGTAAARNRGLDLARAPLTAFLDSDDLWLPGNLASQAALLDARPDAAMALCDGRFEGDWDHAGKTIFESPDWHEPSSLEACFKGAWALPSCVTVRTEAARAVRFDPHFRTMEDTEFLLRFVAAGHVCALNREVLTRYRRHANEGEAPQKTRFQQVQVHYVRMLEKNWPLSPDPRHTRYEMNRRKARMLIARGRWKAARKYVWGWWTYRPHSRKAWVALIRSWMGR